MKLVDKDALVAEIENLLYKGKYYDEYDCAYCDGNNAALYALKGKINSLEVKEVDLETQIEDYINSHFTEGCDGGMISDWYKVLGGVHYKDLVEIAKHFFELGMQVNSKAQKGE